MIKYSICSAVLLALAFATQDVAAQANTASRRGSTKVRARYFNPFDPSASSRFTVSSFGLPQVGTSNGFEIPFFPGDEPAASDEATTTAESSVEEPATEESAVSESAPAAEETEESSASATNAPASVPVAPGLGGGVVNASGRPTFRPPTRSPFRPPPRPPF